MATAKQLAARRAFARKYGGKKRKKSTRAKAKPRPKKSRPRKRGTVAKKRRSTRRRTYRKRGGYKRKAAGLIPKTVPGALATMTVLQNILTVPGTGGKNIIGHIQAGNYQNALALGINRMADPNTWMKPVAIAGVGWAARRMMGPGPRVIGNFRGW